MRGFDASKEDRESGFECFIESRTPLTEDQIEGRVSRAIDRLDTQFMSGKLSQEEYDSGIKAINDAADREYRFRRRD